MVYLFVEIVIKKTIYNEFKGSKKYVTTVSFAVLFTVFSTVAVICPCRIEKSKQWLYQMSWLSFHRRFYFFTTQLFVKRLIFITFALNFRIHKQTL